MTDTSAQPLYGVAIYNPDLLSRSELLRQFVARRRLLARLVEDLKPPRPQHKLLLGTRGMGKTTLLRRLRYAIEDDTDLKNRWIALVFPEEQYNVCRLSDLYINCIDALTDVLEELGDTSASSRLDQLTSGLPDEDAGKLAITARDLLLSEIDRLGKGLVLLIDNADLILDGLPQQEECAFRELLSHEPRLVFIGATVRPLEAEFEYNRAFHDFFQTHELKGFSPAETRDVLRELARLSGAKQVEEWLERDPGRLETLNTLTGGNPRAIVLLYHLLAQGVEGSVRSDLERLLDLYTPHYKARFEDLPKQAQQVLDGLALTWDPTTAADLARTLRVDVNAVSSQLNRLMKHGIVESVSYYPGPKSGYQIAERLFNIWYLMRASRRIRRKLQWLVEFLRVFYSQEDLNTQAKRQLRVIGENKFDDRMKDAEYCFCLAQAVEAPSMRHALETSALHCLIEDRSLRSEIASFVDLEGADTQLKSCAERMQALQEAQEKILLATADLSGQTPEEFWNLLGGTPFLSAEEKRVIADQLDRMRTAQVSHLVEELRNDQRRIMRWLGLGHLTAKLQEAVRSGYMINLADRNGARAASEVLDSPELVAVAVATCFARSPDESTLQELQAVLPQSTSPYVWRIAAKYGAKAGWSNAEIDQAVNRLQVLGGTSSLMWDCVGNALHQLGKYSEAVQAHRRAVSLDAKDAEPWSQIGQLLSAHMGDPQGAEQAYRQAVALSPGKYDFWRRLGDVLFNLERRTEAEEAYRRAISLVPASAENWTALARLLDNEPSRNAECEQAYQQAISLDAADASLWEGLADVISAHPERRTEAEEAIRKALSLDPKRPRSWGILGEILREDASRRTEAEDAYRKALLDPNGNWWGALADLLSEDESRQAEAEEAYRKSIARSPDWPNPWGRLGDLLFEIPGREGDAEVAYRRAVSLNHPYVATPWWKLGVLLSRLPGREAEAEDALRHAIAADPSLDGPWFYLGHLLCRQPDRVIEAAEAFRQAVKLDAQYAPNWHALTNTLLQLGDGNSEEAEAAARRAVELSPTDWRAKQTLAMVLVARAKWIEATEYARNSIALASSESQQEIWPDFVPFFRAAIQAGHARRVVEFLDELELSDKWRPLREAAMAAAENTPSYLKRVAPEIRVPAEKILHQLLPDSSDTQNARQERKRSPARRRRSRRVK